MAGFDFNAIKASIVGLFVKEIPIGIDITNDTIVMVEIKKIKDILQLEKLAIGATPPDTFRDGEVVNAEALADAVAELWATNGFKAKKAITAVSGQSAITRPVRFPVMPDEELKEVITFEAERHIPFSLDEVYIDFQKLGEVQEEGQTRLDVLLVAAQKQLVNSYVSMAKLANLEIVVVDIASFAVARALQGAEHGLADDDQAIASILIRSDTTDINVLKNGIPRFSRSVPLGTNSLVDVIANSLYMTPKEAGTLLDEMVLSIPGHEEQIPQRIEDAAEIIKPVLHELYDEIQRSVNFFQAQGTDTVARVVLSGRGAKIRNLDKFLNSRLGIDVEIGDPLSRLKFDEAQFPPDFLRVNAPLLTTGIGLALRGVEGD